MGSKVVGWALKKLLETSSVVTESKEENIACGDSHGILSEKDICTVEISLEMESICFLNDWQSHLHVIFLLYSLKKKYINVI